VIPTRGSPRPGLRTPPDCAERAYWVQALTARLAWEMGEAVRHGVLSKYEAEQLLARLTVVVDQALGPGP
jgi:hypothetical protein